MPLTEERITRSNGRLPLEPIDPGRDRKGPIRGTEDRSRRQDERRLWVQKGDHRRNAPQRARRAESRPSRPRPESERFDSFRTFGPAHENETPETKKHRVSSTLFRDGSHGQARHDMPSEGKQ